MNGNAKSSLLVVAMQRLCGKTSTRSLTQPYPGFSLVPLSITSNREALPMNRRQKILRVKRPPNIEAINIWSKNVAEPTSMYAWTCLEVTQRENPAARKTDRNKEPGRSKITLFALLSEH